MKIIADSALQLEQETVKALKLDVVEYPLYVNGKEYPSHMAMSREEKDTLRDILRDKKNQVTTSGLRASDLLEAYKKAGGQPILSIHQASKASTATQQAITTIMSENPELHINYFNTHFLTSAYSVIVQQAAEASNNGMDGQELMDYLYKVRSNTRHIGAVYDLFYLHRTGRIGLAKAVMGTAMKIIPLLGSCEIPGELKSMGKVKNYKQANLRFLQIMKQDMEEKKGKHVRAVISVIGPHEEEAKHLKSLLDEQDFPIQSEVHYTNHSNMPHAGPDFYDIGYTVHED